MTATGQRSGATSASAKWQSINWLAVEQQDTILQTALIWKTYGFILSLAVETVIPGKRKAR
ncbi:hypothetical protein S708_004470 [Salmonella enterica subsp. houtenae]|nr:hypothetical protein [Salmonella enterica subsp. houtenae]